MTRSLDLWFLHDAAIAGGPASRKNMTLIMYGTDGQPVARYNLASAWPAKIEIGALKAGASEVLMETVTFECERIERVAP
jgi:phage tail-like protein